MKIYKREIKPYIQPPQLQGFNDRSFPVNGYDWVPEELEDKLRNEIVVDDPWSKLIFVERYVVLGDGVLGEWKAEWIYDHWCEFKCSNCGYWSDSKPYKGKEKYCPECGYKMMNA